MDCYGACFILTCVKLSRVHFVWYYYDTFGALVQLPVPVEVEFQNCYFLPKLTFSFTITKIYIYKLINSYKKKYKFYRLPSHPLLFTLKSLSHGVKKIKSGIFFAEIQKNKNMLPSVLQMLTAVCFIYFLFLQKIYHFIKKINTAYFC